MPESSSLEGQTDDGRTETKQSCISRAQSNVKYAGEPLRLWVPAIHAGVPSAGKIRR